MIRSYRDKRTREFAGGKRVKSFFGIECAAQLKLDRLDSAISRNDLAALPGNRFEALSGDCEDQYSIRIYELSGDCEGQYSIRIYDRWRICFEWNDLAAGPSNVEIFDYH